MKTKLIVATFLGLALFAGACGGGGEQKRDAIPNTAPSSRTAGVEIPEPGGKVVSVEMVTDGEGNHYAPAEVTVKRGDVLRFVLSAGVHNANFVADSNRAAQKLPAATPLLQLPGQTYDVKIDLPAGRYYYHCDPHALLGMIGQVVVSQ